MKNEKWKPCKSSHVEECVKIGMHVGAVARRVAGVSELFQNFDKKKGFIYRVLSIERHGNFRGWSLQRWQEWQLPYGVLTPV